MSDNTVIKHTQAWVQQVVVGFNFCPFAKAEVINQRIHYHPVNSSNLIQDFIDQGQWLLAHPEVSTSLLIYENELSQFYPYLDFVDQAQQALERQGWLGVLQLASFHPHYCFAQSENTDPANYTNRSPYPVLHILREDSLNQVLKDNVNADLIPQRNIRFCQNQGLQQMRDKLKTCCQD